MSNLVICPTDEYLRDDINCVCVDNDDDTIDYLVTYNP